jgi:hypothetical protein
MQRFVISAAVLAVFFGSGSDHLVRSSPAALPSRFPPSMWMGARSGQSCAYGENEGHIGAGSANGV